MTAPEALGTDYELTVVGKLGPVLRAMVEPAVLTSSDHLTIVRMRGDDGQDLVDVLDLFRSCGHDASAISTIH